MQFYNKNHKSWKEQAEEVVRAEAWAQFLSANKKEPSPLVRNLIACVGRDDQEGAEAIFNEIEKQEKPHV